MFPQRRKVNCSFKSFTSLEKLVNSSSSQDDVEGKDVSSREEMPSAEVTPGQVYGKERLGPELWGTDWRQIPVGQSSWQWAYVKVPGAVFLYSSIMSRCKGVICRFYSW